MGQILYEFIPLYASRVKEYPPQSINLPSTVKGVSYLDNLPYGNGKYTTKVSTLRKGVRIFIYYRILKNQQRSQSIFDKRRFTDWKVRNKYDSNGYYIGKKHMLISGIEYYGEWCRIQLPFTLTLVAYSLQISIYEGAPTDFVIAGSNDEHIWTLLDRQDSITYYVSHTRHFLIAPSNYGFSFTTFCILFTGKRRNKARLMVSEWKLYASDSRTLGHILLLNNMIRIYNGYSCPR